MGDNPSQTSVLAPTIIQIVRPAVSTATYPTLLYYKSYYNG